MDSPRDPRLRSNPFATRYTRPGEIAFLFPPGQSAGTVAAALKKAGWWGEIVGPHGSGKSTLLAALRPELMAHGRQVVHFALSQGERQLPTGGSRDPGAGGQDPDTWSEQTQVVIDGYEQLSWWNKRKIQRLCRQRGAGLLITAHEPCGLPTLLKTAPSLELAQSIVRQLLPAGDATISAEDVAAAYDHHPTNLREMLFHLYDLYQKRQP